MFDITNKRAIITGAGQGIGKAIARKFIEKGCKVCIADLDTSKAPETVKEFQEEFGYDESRYERINNSYFCQ